MGSLYLSRCERYGRSVKTVPTARELLFRLPLGVPCATYALIASCVLVTLPLFYDPQYFMRMLHKSVVAEPESTDSKRRRQPHV